MHAPRPDVLARSTLALCVALLAAACGSADQGAPGAVASPPTRGDVWEIQSPDERATAAGSIVAFVNGVHVMVVSSGRVYAGMTALETKSGANGAQTITFPSGLTADMVPAGQSTELRFSSGERVAIHERQ